MLFSTSFKSTLLFQQKQFLMPLVLSSQCITWIVYGFVRLLFYEYPITYIEEAALLAKTALCGLLIAAALYLVVVLYGALKKWFRHFSLQAFTQLAACFLFVISTASVFTACESSGMSVETNFGGKKERMGVVQDNGTGLKATYKNIEPDAIHLVMNGETLNHTDIPLGETFMIVNEGIEGLVQKEGKVSVGCSLRITDSTGQVLLEADDLFKSGGVYDAGNVKYLKCTVSTGKPMQWEENYKVQATFWDKYGDGKINNEVTIRAIDMP
jgi:hypothetical protein